MIPIHNSCYLLYYIFHVVCLQSVVQLVLYLVISNVDIGLHDSHYVVAHFHYDLSLGTIIAILLGLLYVQSDEVLLITGSTWLISIRLAAIGIGMNGLG